MDDQFSTDLFYRNCATIVKAPSFLHIAAVFACALFSFRYLLNFLDPAGYPAAVRDAVERDIPWSKLFKRISSLTTDGQMDNRRDKGGLWALLRKERSESKCSSFRLITLWCGVHRSNLALEDLQQRVFGVHQAITCCSGLAAYFHASVIRTSELKKIAFEKCLRVRHLPKYFKVRFSQLTEQHFESVLSSWRVLVAYMRYCKNADTKARCARFVENINECRSSPALRISS